MILADRGRPASACALSQGGVEEVLDRIARGETLVVTRDGAEVAELRPRTRRSPASADLIARRRHLPPVDPDALRRDLDTVLDSSL